METQKRYAEVRQSVVLAVLLATLFIGGVAGYAVRDAENTSWATVRTVLIPRADREGTDITPIQAPAPRWTHEEEQSVQSYPLIPRVMREGPERGDGTR